MVTRVYVDLLHGTVNWVFDNAAPLLVTGIPVGFECFIDGSWREPVDYEEYGANWIEIDYDDAETATLWRLVPPLTNVSFPGAIVLPQSGVVG